MTKTTAGKRFEDRLLNELSDIVARATPAPEQDAKPAATRARRRIALAFLVVLGGVALAVATLVGGRPASIAQALVLRRASAALTQHNAILHVSAVNYGGNIGLGEEAPIRYIGTFQSDPSPVSGSQATSEPSSYTYEEWTTGIEGVQHTIYGTGDETYRDGHTYRSYDPADNTVTTTEVPGVSSDDASDAPPDVRDFTVTDIENLYRQAQRGEASVRLVERGTIANKEAYVLSIGVPEFSVQLYVDARTFLPLRAVYALERANVSSNVKHVTVTDFVAETLPATPANMRALEILSHPGAIQVDMTQAQLSAARLATNPSFAH